MSNTKSRSSLAGAVIETNASKADSPSAKCAVVEFGIYRIPTRRSQAAVESVLAKQGFVTSNVFNGGFVPRVVGTVEDALALFEGLARPDLVGRSSLSVPDGKIGTVEATKALPYKRSVETITRRNGSKKVTSVTGYINTGLGLCFEPSIVADGSVDLLVRRRLSHVVPGADELQRVASRTFSVRAKLARDQAFVHAEFVADRMPTSRSSGEVVVTLVRASEAGA